MTDQQLKKAQDRFGYELAKFIAELTSELKLDDHIESIAIHLKMKKEEKKTDMEFSKN